ncbi:DUF420 domain-containing protein [Verrucomicrobiaceae bacterium R5-34]|uniref:DUF420 domain-containing protein n=1 Tax=Oceaniferula flava TaxID=2800421 RepID=A0AAE2SEZ4_9BACT|nr:DUF420 domain-containing protein [Oceaniferula flavus]MBK1830057.1 DUF420 domain-containing protein [Verrucomicrobiaceae bacterium R5-34]MBK1855096.1 DUF420 domain-containing protein [Oceaniferula flavus]MBM1136402.1 DUF420 domain-containing protein [Oceaniferula flavus]
MSDYQSYLQRQPDAGKLKVLTRASWVVSILVFSLVVVMGKYKLDIGMDLSFLPPVHAVLNTLVAIFLVLAVVAIKNKNVALHKGMIGGAVACSVLFLLCYVAYHGTQEEVRHGGEGAVRIFYLILLASHIILAAVSLPFILITLSLGHTNHFARHRKMARWVFPLWLYVAATGPICYLMLKPYY